MVTVAARICYSVCGMHYVCSPIHLHATLVANVNIRSKVQTAIVVAKSKSIKVAKLSAGRIVDAASLSSSAIQSVRDWVISVFVAAIAKCSTERDRTDAIAWLALAREVLVQDSLSTTAKAKQIYAITDSRRLASNVVGAVGEAYRNYRTSNTPLAVKVAIPITLTAAAVLGGQSVGIAGFGSAIGMPVLLIIFLGVAGITSVLEAVLSSPDARNYVSIIAYMVANDEILRRSSHTMRKAMSEEVAPPKRKSADDESVGIRTLLLSMNPFDFEAHVMSFFQEAGLFAWVTKKSNDAGVDGFARHPSGLIVVQCKRYSAENGVGRPAVQQFKGVIEENTAWKGFFVTTGYFTREALDSASKNQSMTLIGLDELITWHVNGIDSSQLNSCSQ